MKQGKAKSYEDSNKTALAFLLRPILRFCIRRGIKLQALLEVSKKVFVEVAQEEMKIQDCEPTISRVSIMTGVHRKDVGRLQSGVSSKEAAVDVFTRVVGQWQNDPRFSKRGNPLALSIEGGTGKFSELVQSVSKEINPYTLLFELERLDLISRDGDSVKLVVREYTPKKNPDQAFQMVADDFEDIIGAADENIFRPTRVPNLHLTTRYDNISLESLPKIREWLMLEGEKLHRKARTYLAKFDKDLNPRLKESEGGGRVVIGSFSLTGESKENEK